jgi:hypothetical protein
MESLTKLTNIENLEQAIAIHKKLKSLMTSRRKFTIKERDTQVYIEGHHFNLPSSAIADIISGQIETEKDKLRKLGFTI